MEEEEFDEFGEPVQPSVQTSSSATGSKRSLAWDYFEKFIEDGKTKARCLRCGVVYVADGTKNLNIHYKQRCKNRDMSDQNVQEIVAAPFDQGRYREMTAKMVMRYNLPFNFVEYEGVRERDKYLNPQAEPISRNTCKADVLKVYDEEKGKLKRFLTSLSGRVCLTSDLWTAPYKKNGYVCVTAHFVDNCWVLQKRVLVLRHLLPPHDGVTVGSHLIAYLRDWGVIKKVFSLTLDNAGYNNIVVDSLKGFMRSNGSLVCDGDFLHVRCSAHVLNIIVQAGLKNIGGAIDKIREGVKYIRFNEKRSLQFADCVRHLRLETKKKLVKDVSTRWNSTYLMLQCALSYRRAFHQLALVDTGFTWCPSDEEWEKVVIYAEFLRPFYEITKLFSGSKYPTANLYFLQIWSIHRRLNMELQSPDPSVRKLATDMKPRFDKYWDNYCPILLMAIVLDPRYKLSIVSFAYKKLFEDSGEDDIDEKVQAKVHEVKMNLQRLFEVYLQRTNAESREASALAERRNDDEFDDDLLADFDASEVGSIENANVSQLDLYLDDPRIDRKTLQDVLTFWKETTKYKDLALMARDVLSIPITTVASESTFSHGSRIPGKYRNSMLPENFEAIVCGRDWLEGHEIDEDLLDVTKDALDVANLVTSISSRPSPSFPI